MDLQITGRVIQVLEEQSGQGKNGTWRKQEFVLETPGDYPKQVCCVQWGETITAHIDIQSREYNGRWYTDVKAWRIERGAGAPQGGGQASGPAQNAGAPGAGPFGGDQDDDSLPF